MVENRLRELREAAGLSRSALATAASTSQQQIARLESGERKLTTQWAERLAPHLGVSALHMFVSEAVRGSSPLSPVVGVIEEDRLHWMPDRRLFPDRPHPKHAVEPAATLPEGVPYDFVPNISGGGDTFGFAYKWRNASGRFERGIVGLDMTDIALTPERTFALFVSAGTLRFAEFYADPARMEIIFGPDTGKTLEVGKDQFAVVGRIRWNIEIF